MTGVTLDGWVRRLRKESRARLDQARVRRAGWLGMFAILLSLIIYAGIEGQRQETARRVATLAEKAARDRRDAACAALADKEVALRRELDRKLSFAQNDFELAQLRLEHARASLEAKQAAVDDGCPDASRGFVPPSRSVTYPRPIRQKVDDVTCPCGPSGDCR